MKTIQKYGNKYLHKSSQKKAILRSSICVYCRPTTTPTSFLLMPEPLRLSKRLIELVGCSRREAELYIEGGWVTVNGVIVEEPQFKVLGQQIELLPGASATAIEPVTLLLHQPAGFGNESESYDEALLSLLGASTRWSEDHSDIRMIRKHFIRHSHHFPLPFEAAGLVVFTQDWKVQRKLTDDAGFVEQEFIVEVSGDMVANGLELLKRGSATLPPCKVSWQNETRLRFAMKGLTPSLIKLMCDRIGLHIMAMKRIRIGGVPMGKLPAEQWRYLTSGERF
jgi:23S rRNA pseudouridine2604 synthase